MLEIGGGTGVLTDPLLRTGADVVVVERDPALTALLRTRFGWRPPVEIVDGDAAAHAWPQQAFAVVANLPFARSGAILGHLLRDPRVPLQRAHVIVQWQFAAKHAAVWPATLRSTYWRAWHDLSITRRLDRTAFSPPPRVDAAVLRLERRRWPRVPATGANAYRRFLGAAFASQAPVHRSLRPFLSPLQVKRLAAVLGFGIDAHAWDLDAEQWARVFRCTREGQAVK